MTDEPHGAGAAGHDEPAGLFPLGPPGWEEFLAARRRFEAALGSPGGGRASPRPVPPRRVLGERDVVREWR